MVQEPKKERGGLSSLGKLILWFIVHFLVIYLLNNLSSYNVKLTIFK